MVERRLVTQERREPQFNVMRQLGPGFNKYARQVVDWNTENTWYSGHYWSDSDSVNSPNAGAQWIGITRSAVGEGGIQDLASLDGLTRMTRSFTYTANGIPTFTSWVVGPGGSGGGGAPTGPAGGDLTGTYPNPTIGTGKVTSAAILDGTIQSGDLAPGVIPAPPTSLPPSGPAGGSLAGTYPNPTLAAGSVGSSQIVDGSIQAADLAAGVIPAPPTTLPPNGPAGGDLTGTYPNPDIGAGKVGTAELADSSVTSLKIADGTIQAADLAAGVIPSTPTSLPPNGPAGGDLTGTYPNPTIGAGKVTSTAILDGTILIGDLSSTSVRLDTIAVPTGVVSMNSNRLTSMADGINPTDAATKQQLDNAIQGLDAKQSVRAATTSAQVNIAHSGLQTIDGVTLVANDRVLDKDQSPSGPNGIWVAQSGSWTRAQDANLPSELISAYVFVEEGTVNKDTGWVQTADASALITLGNSSQPWVQFSSASAFTDGAGLLKTGTVLDVVVDNASIEIVADALRVKALGITNAMLAGGVDLTSKVTGALPVANGGTAGTTAATARNNLVVPGKVTIPSPALVANTWSANIAHGLGPSVTAPQVQVTEAASGERVSIDWKVIDINNIQLRAAIAVTAAVLNVVVYA